MAQRWSKKDVSTSLRNSESGMVDSVMLTTNDAGARFVKVRVREACTIGSQVPLKWLAGLPVSMRFASVARQQTGLWSSC